MVVRERDEILGPGIENISYLVVTHVWGQPQNQTLLGVPRICPISDGKLELILSYCCTHDIRFFRLDYTCIKQLNLGVEDHSKEAEVLPQCVALTLHGGFASPANNETQLQIPLTH